jgi:hypothetical protein
MIYLKLHTSKYVKKIKLENFELDMSRITTKPTLCVCDQHGSRPDCTSMQSDQDPCCWLSVSLLVIGLVRELWAMIYLTYTPHEDGFAYWSDDPQCNWMYVTLNVDGWTFFSLINHLHFVLSDSHRLSIDLIFILS